jgi:hypothetical protein
MTRAKLTMPAPRAAALAAGALLMIVPATLLTLAGGPADAASVAHQTTVRHKHSHQHQHQQHQHHRRPKHHELKVVAMTATVASWYYDEGNTACGFTLSTAWQTRPCRAVRR